MGTEGMDNQVIMKMSKEPLEHALRGTRESDKTLENALVTESGQRSKDPLETTIVQRLRLPHFLPS